MFHLFTFFGYYPSGGMDDYEGCYDSLEDAQAAASDSGSEFYQIASSEFKMIESGRCDNI